MIHYIRAYQLNHISHGCYLLNLFNCAFLYVKKMQQKGNVNELKLLLYFFLFRNALHE